MREQFDLELLPNFEPLPNNPPAEHVTSRDEFHAHDAADDTAGPAQHIEPEHPTEVEPEVSKSVTSNGDNSEDHLDHTESTSSGATKKPL